MRKAYPLKCVDLLVAGGAAHPVDSDGGLRSGRRPYAMVSPSRCSRGHGGLLEPELQADAEASGAVLDGVVVGEFAGTVSHEQEAVMIGPGRFDDGQQAAVLGQLPDVADAGPAGRDVRCSGCHEGLPYAAVEAGRGRSTRITYSLPGLGASLNLNFTLKPLPSLCGQQPATSVQMSLSSLVRPLTTR